MLLTLITILFALIALFEGGFLLTHRHKAFMTIDPGKNSTASNLITAWGIIMLAVGIVTVIAAVVNTTAFIITMVILACFLETLMALTMSHLMNL